MRFHIIGLDLGEGTIGTEPFPQMYSRLSTFQGLE